MSTLAEKVFKDETGNQPAADNVSKRDEKEIKEVMMRDYPFILGARTAQETVDLLKLLAKRENLQIGKESDKPFFVTDKDMGISGAEESACAFIKPGKKNSPLRIVISHADSPCLRLTPQPIWFDPDAITGRFCQGFSLMTEPYGGIRKTEWLGKNVHIVGLKQDSRKQDRFEVNGEIKQRSVHVEKEEAIKRYEHLKVYTGIRTLTDLLSTFGLKECADFAKHRYYVVPRVSKNPVQETENDLRAYGQDDRSCVWASCNAFFKAMKQTENTLIALFLDREEVCGEDSSAGYSGFTEAVIKETLKRVKGRKGYRELDLPLDFQRELMGGLPAIIADVDISIGPIETLDYAYGEGIDSFSASKSGWGVSINAKGADYGSANTTPTHIQRITRILDRGLDNKKAQSKTRYQLCGSTTTADHGEASSGTAADVFGKNFPCIVLGPPTEGLHSLEEGINRYDLHWTSKAIELCLKAKKQQ